MTPELGDRKSGAAIRSRVFHSITRRQSVYLLVSLRLLATKQQLKLIRLKRTVRLPPPTRLKMRRLYCLSMELRARISSGQSASQSPFRDRDLEVGISSSEIQATFD